MILYYFNIQPIKLLLAFIIILLIKLSEKIISRFKNLKNNKNNLIKVNPFDDFNEWWNLYLKVFDDIYKDENDKYYYIKDKNIKEIKIINSFNGNINRLTYHKNIKYDNTVIYQYVDMLYDDYYIYYKGNWIKQKN